MQKIERIRTKFDEAATVSTLTPQQPSTCSARFDSFKTLSDDDVMHLIAKSSKKSCSLDPMPTPPVVKCLDVLLPILTRITNLSLQSGCFPENWKLADVRTG